MAPWQASCWCIGLCLGLALTGCGKQDTAQPDATQQGTRLAAAELPGTTQPVALPPLARLEEAPRTQLQEQYDRVQALAEAEGTDEAELGRAYGVLGQLLLAYQLDDAAEPALQNAALLLPDEFQWPYYLGYLYQKGGQLERAGGHYARVLDLQPGQVPTLVHLAEVYRDLGNDAEARRLLHRAVEIDPRCAAAYFLLGQLAGPDETAEAISFYETALRLQPNASVVRYPLGLAYQREGNLERSRQHLAQRGETKFGLADSLLLQLELLKEGAATKLFRGNRLVAQGRHQEALPLYEEVTTVDPDNVEGFMYLGSTHATLGNHDEARAAFEQALRLDPSKSKAHYFLGILAGGRGDEEQAFGHFEAAVAADSTDHLAHYALAKVWWRKRACAEALPHLKAFLAATPQDVEIRIQQAICHVKVDQYADAQDVLETGLSAFPNHPGLRDALVRVLAASDDPAVRNGPRALEMADALAKTMTRTETLESLAMAYAEVGRFPEAVQVQQTAIQAAGQQNLASWLPHLNATLQRYQQGQPCRTPWAAVIFDK